MDDEILEFNYRKPTQRFKVGDIVVVLAGHFIHTTGVVTEAIDQRHFIVKSDGKRIIYNADQLQLC
jgi:transcription antitermination factor NusG